MFWKPGSQRSHTKAARPEKVENETLKLPVVKYEDALLHAVENHQVTLLIASTGSGNLLLLIVR